MTQVDACSKIRATNHAGSGRYGAAKYVSKKFMRAMADIQENCVQTALCRKDEGTLEGRFYDVASEVIVRIMELMDGYGDFGIGTLKVIQEETGESLKEALRIELHDAVCTYIKGI